MCPMTPVSRSRHISSSAAKFFVSVCYNNSLTIIRPIAPWAQGIHRDIISGSMRKLEYFLEGGVRTLPHFLISQWQVFAIRNYVQNSFTAILPAIGSYFSDLSSCHYESIMCTQNGSSNWRFCTLRNENSNINSTLFVIVYIVIVHVDLIVLYVTFNPW